MLETLKQTVIINFTISLNSWIYFLKKIPIVKLLFINVGFEHSDLTTSFYMLGFLYSMFKQLAKSAMLLLLSFGLPLVFIKGGITGIDKTAYYWHIFYLFYLLLALPTSKILEPHRRKFISVKLMRINARSFVIADYFPQLLWRVFVELPLFTIVARIFAVNLLLALFMVLAKNFLSVLAEALKLYYYDRTGTFVHNKTTLILTYSMVVIGLGYFTSANQTYLILPTPVIFTLGALLCILGIFSGHAIIQYDKYAAAINDANPFEKLNVDMQSVKRNATFSKVKLKDKEFTKEELLYDKANKKDGFAFINEIFFRRHKRILNDPIKKQTAAVIVLFTAAVIASFFVKDFHKYYVTVIQKAFPVLIFLLYVMSTGQKATKAMFYNCDISLLHYGFYKTNEAVLATFTIRTRYLILANMIPAAFIAVGIILLNVITGGSFQTFLPVGIMAIVLSIFFAVHNMFLYYIFQPYTTDLTIKNPFFKLFNFITYILCYTSLQLRNMSTLFLIIVIAATLIYSIAALITVYRIAPRTFTVK